MWMGIQEFPGFGVDSFCWLVTDCNIFPLEFLTSTICLPLVDVVIS